ncbi:MAG TPA: cell division protein FtsK, partial [Isosphaeraceae bacterium]|nr:cell division protein FtsK [Isosphaeraceae bacterium]
MSTLEQSPPATPVAQPCPSTEPDLIQKERATLRELLRLVAERAAAETQISGTISSSDTSADEGYQKSRAALVDKFENHKETYRKGDEDDRRAIVTAAITGETEAKNEFARASRKIAGDFDRAREQTKNEYLRGRTEATATFEAGERDSASKYAEALRPIGEATKIIESMTARTGAIFADYQKFGLEPAPTTATRETYRVEDTTGLLFDRLHKIEPDLALLEGLFIPKAVKGYRWLWIFLILFLVLIYPSVILTDNPIFGTIGALCGAILLGFAALKGLYSLSKSQVSRLYYPVCQALVDAQALAAHCLATALERNKQERAKVAERRDEEFQKAKEKQARTIAAAEGVRDDRLRRINEVYAERMVEIQTTQQVDLRNAIASYQERSVELEKQFQTGSRKLDEKYQDIKGKIQTRRDSSWRNLAARWREGTERVRAELDQIGRAVDAFGPAWDDPSWNDRPFPSAVPPVLRCGEVPIRLADLEKGVAADPRLMEGVPTQFNFPALRVFPERANLLIEAPAQGRAAAIGVLQAAMLRLLTSLPPAQVRFTIVDPVGIGRNFGA